MTTPLDNGPRLKLNRSGYWTLVSAERGEDGKWRTRTVSCGTRDEAQAQAFRRSFVTASADEAPETITVGSLIKQYLEDASDRQITRGQFQALKQVGSLLGDYRPDEVTIDMQRAYGKQRCAYGKHQRPASAGSIRRELGALIAVFNWAETYKKLDRGERPAIKLPDAPPPRDNWLDEADEARLWGLAAEDRDAQGRLGLAGLFVCLALGTGARSGAIYALTWDRVDLVSGKIDFRVPGERVTRKRKVSTVINTRLLPVLRLARADYPFGRKVIGHEVRRRLDSFLTQHGFGRITPHAFRHTFVTLSLRAGMAVWDVAGLAGMSPNMVQKVYGHHVADDRLRAEANRRFT